MSQFRSKILIFGLLLIAVAAALLTVLILYASGIILVDRVEMVFTVLNAEKVYDGEPLYANDYVLESGELLKDHTARVEIKGSRTDAGIGESSLEVTFYDKKGFDVSDKYVVKVNAGQLTVNPQSITAVLNDAKAVYNGREVEFDDYVITSGQLATGHRIAGSVAGAALLNVDDELPADLKPVIYDAAGKDVTANYILMYSIGNAKILPRPITVRPKNLTKIYDGKEISVTEYEVIEGSLATGQSARASITATRGGEIDAVNAGETQISIDEDDFIIYADDGSVVTGNYDIKYETAMLKIEKRDLILTSASQSWTYDGCEHYNDKIEIISGSLAPEQEIEVTGFTRVKNAEEKATPNELTFGIKYGETDVIGNYNVTYRNGSLKINKMNLTVYSKSYEKVYDGKSLEELMNAENTYETSPTLSDRFRLTAQNDGIAKLVDVCSGSYKLEISITEAEGGADCIDNFSLSVISGNYAIRKKPVNLELQIIQKGYNGEAYDLNVDLKVEAFKNEQLTEYSVNADDFTLKSLDGEIKDAGNYGYTAVYGGDAAGNYDFTIIQSAIQIAKANVNLAFKDPAKAYSVDYGTDFKCSLDDLGINEFATAKISYAEFESVLETDEVKQLNGSVKIVAKTTGSGKNLKGSAKATVKNVKVSLGGEDVTPNLIINYGGAETTVTVEKCTLLFKYEPVKYKGEDFNPDWLYGLADVSVGTPLASGDRLIEKSIDYSDTQYYVDSYVILNADGVDVSALYYYDESENFGLLELT